MKQSTARNLPWPALTAALAFIVIAAVLILLSRAHTRATAPPPAAAPPAARPTTPARRPTTPTRRPEPAATPAASAVALPTAVPTVAPEPTTTLPEAAPPVLAPAPAPGGAPQPLVVRAFRQGPEEFLLAVTFSAPLAEATKLKVEVASAQQKLAKRQSVVPRERVDLGDNIYAFEPEPTRHARFDPGQPVSVQLWVGDAPPRQFEVVVTRGWYGDVRGVRLADERPAAAP